MASSPRALEVSAELGARLERALEARAAEGLRRRLVRGQRERLAGLRDRRRALEAALAAAEAGGRLRGARGLGARAEPLREARRGLEAARAEAIQSPASPHRPGAARERPQELSRGLGLGLERRRAALVRAVAALLPPQGWGREKGDNNAAWGRLLLVGTTVARILGSHAFHAAALAAGSTCPGYGCSRSTVWAPASYWCQQNLMTFSDARAGGSHHCRPAPLFSLKRSAGAPDGGAGYLLLIRSFAGLQVCLEHMGGSKLSPEYKLLERIVGVLLRSAIERSPKEHNVSWRNGRHQRSDSDDLDEWELVGADDLGGGGGAERKGPTAG